jgi:hypothetical protein
MAAIFHREALEELIRKAAGAPEERPMTTTMAEFQGSWRSSPARMPITPAFKHLDEERVTRRQGITNVSYSPGDEPCSD